MKTAFHRLSSLICTASTAVMLALSLAPHRAQGADRTWSGGGGDNNWSTAANWGGVAPVAGDSLTFAGNIRTTPVNDLPAGTIFRGITFSGGAGLFTVTGNAIILTNGSNNGGGTVNGGSISNLSANAQTINLPLAISAGQHYIATVAGSGQLGLNGTITRNPGATVAFSRLGGNINLSGSGLAVNNDILGGWATFGGVNATNWATLDGGGNIVALSGASITTVAGGGTISSGAGSNVRVTPSGAAVTLAAAGTTELNSLLGAATGANQVVDVGTGNTLRLSPAGGILNATPGLGTTRIFTVGATAGQGFLTAGGADNTPGELFFIDTPINSGSGNNLVINPVVRDNGSGVVSVHIQGYVQFNGAVNTFSGGTFINQGRVQAGGVNCFGTGPVYVFNGGHIFLNVGNGTWTNDFFIAGVGSPESGGIGAIRMGGSRTLSGTVRLMENASTGNGTITGPITGPGGLIVGSGTANGSGTLTLGGATPNDYAGDTVINNSNPSPNAANILRTITANKLPHGAGKGNLILNGVSATVFARFDLAGTDQTINGLSSSGSAANTAVTNSVAGTPTLTVGDGDANGVFAGLVQNGTGDLALTKIGAGTQTLSGANTYSGPTTVNAGKLVTSTASTGAGSYTVADGATLGVRVASAGSSFSASTLTLGSSALEIIPDALENPSAAAVNVTGDLTINGTVVVNLTAGQVGTFTVLQHSGARNGLGAFVLGALPPRTIGTLLDDIANQRVTITITAVEGALTWAGDATGNWDINNALNLVWKNTFSGLPRFYQETAEGNDRVQFDDTATGTTTIHLTTALSPSAVLVNNATLPYTFTGPGKLSGSGSLTKSGAGTLLIDNSGSNDFSGPVTINAGTVQVGNADANGNLGSGSVANNGALTFNRTDHVTVGNAISGSGSVTHNGSATLTLSGANTFAGPVTVAQGMLKAGNGSALGSTNGASTIASGATLDVNGFNLGLEPVTVSGSGVEGKGAIVNNTGSPAFVAPNLANVTLTDDTIFGGTGRWDLRSADATRTNASLSTLGNPFSLTKVGTNQVSLVGVVMDPALGEIEVREGTLSVERATTSLGDPLNSLTVFNNAVLQFFQLSNVLSKILVLKDGATVFNNSGANTYGGPVTLEAGGTFNVGGTSLTLNQVTGPGRLIKIGASPLILSGVDDHSGGTVVSNGTLFVEGSSTAEASPITVYGGTLGGLGSIGSPIVIAANGTLAPGNLGTPIGSLTVLFTPLTLGGTNLMDVDKTGGAFNNDRIFAAEPVTFGGTLQLNLTGEPLAAGDVITLYLVGPKSGAFSRIVPSTPGPSLAWNTSQILVDGTLRVVLPPTPGIADVSIADGNVVFVGTNGTPGTISYVLGSTNVVLPVENWVRIATNVFDSNGNFSFTNAVNPNTPEQFFRLQLP